MSRRLLIYIVTTLLWPIAHCGLAAGSETDLQKALAALSRAGDPKERLRQVRRLLAIQGPRAAAALSRVVERDPSVDVRVGAARALGLIRADTALELLIGRLRDGGPRAVRLEVARAIRRREGSAAALLKLLGKKGTRVLDRGLILRAFEAFDDAATRTALISFATGKHAELTGEAIRALAQRSDARAEREALWKRLLEQGRSVDALLPVLDEAEALLTPGMRPALERLTTFMEPAIRESADHLLRILRARESAPAPKPEKKKPADRYGGGGGVPPPEGPPHTPEVRGRFDMVYVLDATGSTHATLPELKKRILREMALLSEVGGNVRVGIVAYRGGRSPAERVRQSSLLPLTYDSSRVVQFLAELDARGVDNRGASVAHALHEALDRMGWRWSARRTVQLFADSRCEDARFARDVVSIHFRADRTRTRIAYVLRTRTQIPPEYAEIARRGGTGKPELIK